MLAEPKSPELISPRLRPGADLLAEGRAMAREWRVGGSPFMTQYGVRCEAEWKRKASAEKRIMQHAHIGFRDVNSTIEGIRTMDGTCADGGITVDRLMLRQQEDEGQQGPKQRPEAWPDEIPHARRVGANQHAHAELHHLHQQQ